MIADLGTAIAVVGRGVRATAHFHRPECAAHLGQPCGCGGNAEAFLRALPQVLHAPNCDWTGTAWSTGPCARCAAWRALGFVGPRHVLTGLRPWAAPAVRRSAADDAGGGKGSWPDAGMGPGS